MNADEIKDIRRWLDASDGLADGRALTGDRRLDAIVDVLQEMAAQIWVVRRRNAFLEDVLAKSGVLSTEALESHVMAPEQTAALRAERAAFVASIFRAMAEVPTEPTNS